MQINSRINEIVDKVYDGLCLTRQDIGLSFEGFAHSVDAGLIIGVANEINRIASKGKAEVHAQIGLNLSPCPNNCSFCAFSAENKVFTERKELGVEEIVHLAFKAEVDGANAIFFMTTHDYPFGKYIETSKEVREKLKPETVMIANIGDFGYGEAKQLKDAGYTGIYHAVRMGEGKDTRIAPEVRLNTIRAAREAGLLIGTCVEPIGPEHSIEEIADKILIGREMGPCFSGAMRRINIPGSPAGQTWNDQRIPTGFFGCGCPTGDGKRGDWKLHARTQLTGSNSRGKSILGRGGHESPGHGSGNL